MRKACPAKNILLTSASFLAIALAAGEARAVTFDFTGIETTWVAPASGLYDIAAYGAAGAPSGSRSADWAQRPRAKSISPQERR